MLSQKILKEYCSYLKFVKYKGIIQNIKLEYCTDKDENNPNDGDTHIILRLIQIRKPQRNKGYGSLVLKDIIKLANINNIRVVLYASEKYGSEINRLYKFYQNHNFTLIENDIYNKMIYYPENN